jgi:hypothetical protein
MRDETRKQSRRAFMKSVGTVSAAAAIATALPPERAQAATESDQEKKKARYKETDHVKAFYRTNRY